MDCVSDRHSHGASPKAVHAGITIRRCSRAAGIENRILDNKAYLVLQGLCIRGFDRFGYSLRAKAMESLFFRKGVEGGWGWGWGGGGGGYSADVVLLPI